jgi:hypothetical protein
MILSLNKIFCTAMLEHSYFYPVVEDSVGQFVQGKPLQMVTLLNGSKHTVALAVPASPASMGEPKLLRK